MEGLRTNIARYAARFPRYRRLMEQAGFTEELQAVRRFWNEGNHEEARRLIPAELIDKIALVGDADQCRRKLDDYRRAGITQPIISPRVSPCLRAPVSGCPMPLSGPHEGLQG